MLAIPASRFVAVIVLCLALAGCGRGQSSNSDRDQVDSVAPPTEGACRTLEVEDLGLPTNTTRTVDCSKEHNAVTMTVGELPVAYAEEPWDSELVAQVSYALCAGKFAEFLGADESSAMRTLLGWSWFRPSEKAWEAGARWYRCDLVGGDGTIEDLLNLPQDALGILAQRDIDRWMACADADVLEGAPRVPCTAPHRWRAVTTIKVAGDAAPYPGEDGVVDRTRKFCSDSVAAWLAYPADYEFAYTVFGPAEWSAGNRRSICWAKTER